MDIYGDESLLLTSTRATRFTPLQANTRLPFDVAMLRTMRYRLDAEGRPSHAAEDSGKLEKLLKKCREQRVHDSPLFQLIAQARERELLAMMLEEIAEYEQIKQAA